MRARRIQRPWSRAAIPAPVLPVLLLLCSVLLSSAASAAELISRTIVVDGNLSDWYAPIDITNHPGQFSEDCQGGQAPSCDADFPVSGTGRDLKKFSYTWDNSHLYFYVERWASSSNTTNWLFYLDQNANGLMEAGERIFLVEWSGSNRRTNAYLCPYFPANPQGDPLVDPVTGRGDGYTMPGGTVSSSSGCTALDEERGGASSGTEMESRVAWSQLGLPGPQNMRFHIASSQNLNLPGQVIDNMDGPGGPGGGGLFPPDMSITLDDVPETLISDGTFTFSVNLDRTYFDDFSDINVAIDLGGLIIYQGHAAPAGTSFVDTSGNGIPDTWQIPLLQQQESRVLQITAKAAHVTDSIQATLSATLSAWQGEDSDASNNQDVAIITLLPGARLSVEKTASVAQANPGEIVRYTVQLTNTGDTNINDIAVTNSLPKFVALRVNGFGPGQALLVTGMAAGAVQYADDGGLSFAYIPVGNEDAQVTDIRVPLSGVLAPADSVEIIYEVRISE